MTIIESFINTYNGLSSDVKPTTSETEKIPNGSRFREVDTGNEYRYNSSDDSWYFFPSGSQNIDSAGREGMNTVFGDSVTAVRQADIAAQFQYGFPASAAEPETANGGTISIVESMLVLSTSADPAGLAALSNRRALRYLPGEEAFTGFTCVFSTPKPDTFQCAGIFDDQNGFFVGYEGEIFYIFRRRAGTTFKSEVDLSSVYPPALGVFDPTKGNIYRITFGYYGFAPITFEVSTPTGGHALLGRIEYPNSETVTHITNTNLQPRAEVQNTGNTSDMTIKVGSFSAGVINGGGNDPAARRVTFARSAQTITAGTLMVVTFRSKSTFSGLTNYIRSLFTLLSFNTDLSKSSLWELEKNAEITNSPTWNDINTLDSTIQYSLNAAITIGTGEDTFPLPLGKVDRVLLSDLEKEQLDMLPGDHYTLFITTPTGTTGTFDYSFRIKELF